MNRQLTLWGEQTHRNNTGSAIFQVWADYFKAYYDAEKEEDGDPSWATILQEEVYEALSETDYEKLRTELIQVAAVAVSWVEDLDRQEQKRVYDGE